MAVTQIPTVGTALRTKPTGRIGLNVLASEWTKIRSVRSTYWTLLITAATTIGLSALVCAVFAAQYAHLSPQEKAGFDPASFSLIGGILAQLAIAVLGVMVITSEYASGMIRTTFSAVPQRLTVLAAKATVFTAVTLAVTTTACFIASSSARRSCRPKALGSALVHRVRCARSSAPVCTSPSSGCWPLAWARSSARPPGPLPPCSASSSSCP